MVGWLVLILQPLLKQGCSSEASWFFFNPLLKFSAPDDCTVWEWHLNRSLIWYQANKAAPLTKSIFCHLFSSHLCFPEGLLFFIYPMTQIVDLSSSTTDQEQACSAEVLDQQSITCLNHITTFCSYPWSTGNFHAPQLQWMPGELFVWLCKPLPWLRGTTSCALWGGRWFWGFVVVVFLLIIKLYFSTLSIPQSGGKKPHPYSITMKKISFLWLWKAYSALTL